MNADKKSLYKDGKELKVFTFEYVDQIGRTSTHHYLGYEESELVSLFFKEFRSQPGFIAGNIEMKGSFGVQNMLDKISLSSDSSEKKIDFSKIPVREEKTEPISSIEKFKYSLMLSADKYIKNKKDKETIQKIIGKLKASKPKPISNTINNKTKKVERSKSSKAK